jgi:L-amino acid N-acyltransferase YncA
MITTIRQAKISDAEQILAIYRPIVETTAISFELVVPTADEIAGRIHSVQTSHEWLVALNSEGISDTPMRPSIVLVRRIDSPLKPLPM